MLPDEPDRAQLVDAAEAAFDVAIFDVADLAYRRGSDGPAWFGQSDMS